MGVRAHKPDTNPQISVSQKLKSRLGVVIKTPKLKVLLRRECLGEWGEKEIR